MIEQTAAVNACMAQTLVQIHDHGRYASTVCCDDTPNGAGCTSRRIQYEYKGHHIYAYSETLCTSERRWPAGNTSPEQHT